ncbi:hypothetical protein SOVF_046190, partial [Spinacia oleracea]
FFLELNKKRKFWRSALVQIQATAIERCSLEGDDNGNYLTVFLPNPPSFEIKHHEVEILKKWLDRSTRRIPGPSFLL